MCGIVGIFNLINDRNRTISEEHQATLINLFLTEGLYHTEKRGKDATGYACIFRDGEVIGLKNGEKASKFIFDAHEEPKQMYKDHMRVLEQYHTHESPISVIIGHCRNGTVGSAYDNRNNHPIVVDSRFFGIHNGTLSNHNVIEEKLNIKRDGKVDSEVLVHMAKIWKTDNDKSFDTELCDWINARIEGPCVTFLVDKDDPTKIAWLKSVRPLVFCYIKEAGLLLAVSEVDILDSIKEEYAKLKNVYNVDIPDVSFRHTSIPDKKCGIIDTEKEIAVIDNPNFKDIEDILVSSSSIEDYTIKEFAEPARTYGYYRTYNNNTANVANNAANNNTNGYKSKPSIKIEDKADDSENKALPEQTKVTDMISTCVYAVATNSYVVSNTLKKDIYPTSVRQRKINWPISVEKIRPLKDCDTAYKLETAIRRELDIAYKSLTVMNGLEIAQKVERVTLQAVGKHVEKLEKQLDKKTRSSAKARKRIFAAKKFINAILPYTHIDADKLEVAMKELTADDIEFLQRIIKQQSFDKSPKLEDYIKATIQRRASKNA